MSKLNNTEDFDEGDFWEPLLEDKKAMARKRYRDKQKAKGLDVEDPIKKTFHIKDLAHFAPKTRNQKAVCDSFYAEPEKNFFLYGYAGTGKTFLALRLAFEALLDKSTPYEKIYVTRSAVPSREQGFLPGDLDEKMAEYEAPYVGICDELFKFGSRNWENLKKAGYVEFVSTSFLRGRTLNDCIIVVDETQNMNFGELQTILTRCGYNCKIFFSGDSRQNDLINNRNRNDISGFQTFLEILESPQMEKHFTVKEFDFDDIVRSQLVRDYIIACEEYFDSE